jgi:excisionase family DNA binding protein
MEDYYKSIQQKFCSEEKFVSAAKVAEYLDLNIWTIYKWAERKKIPSYKLGKSLRFKLSELEDSICH